MSGSSSIFLDTNAIINALGKSLFFPENNYLVSIITEMELLSFAKITSEDEAIIKNMLENFEIINISSEVKNTAIEFRKKYALKMPDSIICASAKSRNAILISDDKQLSRVAEIKVLSLDEFTAFSKNN